MSFFLSTNEFNITKNEEKYSYNIEFKNISKALIRSITETRLIIGATITDNYRTLTFKAITIQTLEEFQESLIERNDSKRFTHDLSLKLAFSLSTQLQYLLTKTRYSFLKYETKNILVIDEEVFIYLSNEHLVKREQEDINIILPFSKKEYISPELLYVRRVPEKINYRTIYYSLGLLVAHCSIFNKEEEEEEDIFNSLEKSIGKTKLFYFLKRCLHEDIKKRMLVYI